MCWCERWDFTCNTEHVNKIRRLLLSHIGCINLIFQSKVQRSVTNNFSISEGPRISITITVQSKVHRSLTNNFSNSEAPRMLLASGLRSPPTFGIQLTRADDSWDRLINREQRTENQKQETDRHQTENRQRTDKSERRNNTSVTSSEPSLLSPSLSRPLTVNSIS